MLKFQISRKKNQAIDGSKYRYEITRTFSRVCESLFIVFLKAIWISASKMSSSASWFSSEVDVNGSQSPNVTICSLCPELASNSAAWALLAACKTLQIFNYPNIWLIELLVLKFDISFCFQSWATVAQKVTHLSISFSTLMFTHYPEIEFAEIWIKIQLFYSTTL